MRILCLDIPRAGVTMEDYAPHMLNETKHAWEGYKNGIIRDIYFRQDRPGVVIIAEADSVEEARKVCADFPLAKAGLLTFEFIPYGPYTFWESLFAAKHQSK